MARQERLLAQYGELQPQVSDFTKWNKKIGTFVDTMQSSGHVVKEPGSNDTVAWHETLMPPEEVQKRLQESSLQELLVPEKLFSAHQINSSDLVFAKLRVRTSSWEKVRKEGNEFKRYPDEIDWKKGVSIKLRYETDDRIARQFVSLSAESATIEEPPTIKRSFVPPVDTLEVFSRENYKMQESKDLKVVKANVKDFLDLAQAIYDNKKPIDDLDF